MLLELHINLSPGYHQTDCCAICCMLFLLQALPPAEKHSSWFKKKKVKDYAAMFITFPSCMEHQDWCEAALPSVGFKIFWAVNSKWNPFGIHGRVVSMKEPKFRSNALLTWNCRQQITSQCRYLSTEMIVVELQKPPPARHNHIHYTHTHTHIQ